MIGWPPSCACCVPVCGPGTSRTAPTVTVRLRGRAGPVRSGASPAVGSTRGGGQLLGRLGEVLRSVDGPPVRALRQRETRQAALARQPGKVVRSWSPRSGSRLANAGENTYTPALIRYGDGGDSMKSSTWPNSSVSTAPQGIRGRARASVAVASRSAWNAAISRREKRVQMSPLVAYQGCSGSGSRAAAYLRPPPRPSGSCSTTVVTRSGSSDASSHSWSTSARWPHETTASVTPSAASQAS